MMNRDVLKSLLRLEWEDGVIEEAEDETSSYRNMRSHRRVGSAPKGKKIWKNRKPRLLDKDYRKVIKRMRRVAPDVEEGTMQFHVVTNLSEKMGKAAGPERIRGLRAKRLEKGVRNLEKGVRTGSSKVADLYRLRKRYARHYLALSKRLGDKTGAWGTIPASMLIGGSFAKRGKKISARRALSAVKKGIARQGYDPKDVSKGTKAHLYKRGSGREVEDCPVPGR